MKKHITLLLSVLAISVQAQVYNMIYNWSDTANDCIGTLYDNGDSKYNDSNNRSIGIIFARG